MIAPGVVDEIHRLLAEGRLSQRKIARAVGVSRGTVGAIARGQRPERRPRARQRADEVVAPRGPVRRCPECGGLVYTPCLACQVRALLRRGKLGERQSRAVCRGYGRWKQ